MLMTAAVEGLLAGRPFSPAFHGAIAHMADAWAAGLDSRGRPPRQGDSDDAVVLLLDPPDRLARPGSLLAAAAAIVGDLPWWPPATPGLRSRLFAALYRERPPPRAGSTARS